MLHYTVCSDVAHVRSRLTHAPVGYVRCGGIRERKGGVEACGPNVIHHAGDRSRPLFTDSSLTASGGTQCAQGEGVGTRAPPWQDPRRGGGTQSATVAGSAPRPWHTERHRGRIRAAWGFGEYPDTLASSWNCEVWGGENCYANCAGPRVRR